jgi:hypothetical protein
MVQQQQQDRGLARQKLTQQQMLVLRMLVAVPVVRAGTPSSAVGWWQQWRQQQGMLQWMMRCSTPSVLTGICFGFCCSVHFAPTSHSCMLA